MLFTARITPQTALSTRRIPTLPRPRAASLGTVLLHSAHIIHACPATKLQPTIHPLDVPRRFDHAAGYLRRQVY
jgi:hypothetical protein